MPDPDVEEIPDALKERDHWLLHDESRGRRPHWRGDFGISWSDETDWRSFEEAIEAAEARDSWGIGYVVQPRDPFFVIDVDEPYDDNGERREWLPPLDRFFDAMTYVEESPSGNGLHILAPTDPPEWWSDCEVGRDVHQGVECLTNKFCTVTGDRVDGAGSEPAHADGDEWLLQAYRNIEGELPRMQDAEDVSGTDARDEWAEDDIDDALGALDPDVAHDEWIRIGYAVHDWDSGSAGKRLFTQWSRGGQKFDSGAEREIDWIWNNASAGGGVTVGTLIHKAQEAGWSPPKPATDGGATAATTPQRTGEGAIGGLSPDGVAALAGLGEDGSIADLNDREKAAHVWELLKGGDTYHVRVRRDNGSLWAYDDGVWKPNGERALRHAARQALGAANYGSNVLTELKAQARGDPQVEVAADEFGVDAGLVAVENGLLDLEAAATGGDALQELEPTDYALAQLPVEYDSGAEFGEWGKYVDEWAEDGRADALQEYVGYCLHIDEMPIHRAMLLVGSGANGKGTFLSVVRTLLGEENTSSIELQTLANERDAVAEFYGSIANIDDDLSARKLGAGLGMFKKLVAGDRVRARRLYEDGFEFDATGKHLYAANEVPDVQVPDDDEAFWRRWLLVEFPNHYPPSDREPDLRDRFTEPEALAGVLNWAIEGWRRLFDQGHFTNEAQYAHAKRERWQKWGDSVDMFINECVERDSDAENVSTTDVHRVYAAWCRDHDEKPVSQQNLTAELKNEDLDYGQSVRPGGTGSPTRGFKALGFTDEAPDIDETPERGTGQQSLDRSG